MDSSSSPLRCHNAPKNNNGTRGVRLDNILHLDPKVNINKHEIRAYFEEKLRLLYLEG